MLFGIEPIEIVFSFKQLGLALAGASALWGMVFVMRGRKDSHGDECFIFGWVAERLLLPLVAGIGTAMLAVVLLSCAFPVFAHEGIVLVPTPAEVGGALSVALPLYGVWVLTTLAALSWLKRRPADFNKHLFSFYAVSFVFACALISIPALTGSLNRAQIFFTGHGFHSIFTLGTVLVLDFLFLMSKSSPILKQHIYPMFPLLSKVIWVGLGIDFLSVALVFDKAIALTPKFFFMQTVVGILIVNGTLLSGPITRRMLASVREGGEAMTKRWTFIADVAGTISISSWGTITFVDAFAHLSLSYPKLLAAYLTLIACLFAGHLMWEHLHQKPLPVVFSRT